MPAPECPRQHRYEWRYLVGFVNPASGRTVFHLTSTVSIPLFEVELAAFSRAVGAGPRKQIVLVLDLTGWHTSLPWRAPLHVPGHVHPLFLPAYSPELLPVEHLWALTTTALANRHFATIDALEDAQAERCVTLPARPDPLRHPLPLVAATHQETTRTEAKLVSDGWETEKQVKDADYQARVVHISTSGSRI